MIILGNESSNVNIDGNVTSLTDFGGVDTYTILNSLSADVTITDNNISKINLPEGLDVTAASFLSDGVQFTVNGNTVTLLGNPAAFSFVFGGTPLDPGAGSAQTYAQTALAFGTTLPAPGEAPNPAFRTGLVQSNGTIGSDGDLSTSKAVFFLLDEVAETEGNPDRLSNIDIDGLRFDINGVEVTLRADLANVAGTHQGFVNALQAPLQALIADGTLPVGTTLTLDPSITDTTFLDDGSISDNIPAMVLTPGGGAQVIPIGFSFIDEAVGVVDVYGSFESISEVDNTAPIGQPIIMGFPIVGEELFARTDAIFDRDGFDPSSASFQWLRNVNPIPGATDASYTVTEADRGWELRVAMTYVDGAGNTEIIFSDSEPMVPFNQPTSPNSPLTYVGQYSVEYAVETIPANTGGSFLVASADLDGNGYTDLLLADGVFPPDPIRPTFGDIIYQHSTGFNLEDNSFTGTIHPREIIFSDFNVDGVDDFFVAAHGYDAPPFPGERNVLMLSNEQGYVDSQPILTHPDGFTHSAAAGDIDLDGDIDILSVNITPNPNVVLYVNDGSGSFSNNSNSLPSSIQGTEATFSATSSLIHDIDGDGYPDILLGSQNTAEYGASRILFGDGNPFVGGSNVIFDDSNITLLADVSAQRSNQIIVDMKPIDIDLDGDDDIVTSYTLNDPFYSGAGIQVFRNDGSRTFTDVSEEALFDQNFQSSENWIVFLEILDFNGDGFQDIFLDRAGADMDSVIVYLGTGVGQFLPLYGRDVISDNNFEFLLTNTFPGHRNGGVELVGAQYFEGSYIISRINIEEPPIV